MSSLAHRTAASTEFSSSFSSIKASGLATDVLINASEAENNVVIDAVIMLKIRIWREASSSDFPKLDLLKYREPSRVRPMSDTQISLSTPMVELQLEVPERFDDLPVRQRFFRERLGICGKHLLDVEVDFLQALAPAALAAWSLSRL